MEYQDVPEAPLTRGEFRDGFGELKERLSDMKDDIRDDIRGIHDRLDALNGRTRKNESDIAVLQDRDSADRQVAKRAGRNHGALWGGIIAGLAAAGRIVADYVKK
jgi:tetrahydromethanopterin S-methyltransferase subunit G